MQEATPVPVCASVIPFSIRRTAASLLLVLLASRPAFCAQAGLWLDGRRLSTSARQAVTFLLDAGSEGLNPAAYRAGELAAQAARLAEGSAAIADASRFELALSEAMVRFLRDVHMGRIDPRHLGLRLVVPDDGHDFPALLEEAVRARRLPDLLAEFRPPYRQYHALRGALRHYRQLAADSQELAPLAARLPVRPGDRYENARWLADRLVFFGDLPANARVGGDLYAGVLVDGVERFQTRHGLAVDGVIGPATLATLRVPAAARVRQIELALERLRWLPHQQHDRVIVINIPTFRLWGWNEPPSEAAHTFSTGVIVGRAVSTETPVFAAELREVIFRPYWNVPRSIVVKELHAILTEDTAAFARAGYELVQGQGDAAPVVEPSHQNLERLRRGELRLRQRPGSGNALGLVKFVLPNDESVYLHDTPAHALFSRSRRDFSHGCVRVEEPAALAEWVLAKEGGWSRDRVLEAMHADRTQSVRLSAPIDVLLFYTTTIVDGDGTVRFADDIYGHDARLSRALTAATSAR
jgi:murein L,D-transpeptidase YcbB/YkuD